MKLAIVKLSAMGDIIHSAFVLQFIKQKIPNIHIEWIVESSFAGILEHNKDIDFIKKLNLKSIKEDKSNIFREIKKVKAYAKEEYDLVIDLQGLVKSSIVSKLLGDNIIGYDKDSIREGVASYLYNQKFSIPYHLNTIDRYRLLVSKSLGIEITKDEVLNKKPYLGYQESSLLSTKEYFSTKKPNLIFIVGANWDSRVYPKEQLLEVATSIDANILVPWGNETERQRGEWLQTHAKNITLLPKLNLDELKALISNSDLLIGNDTGPSYIAWANNVPSVLLFGPTPKSRVYGSNICKRLESSSKVDPYKLDKNDYSIKEIKPIQIIESIKDMGVEI